MLATQPKPCYTLCMKTSLVRLLSTDNLRLDGLLFEPTTKTNKVVIHVHGTGGDFYRNIMIDFFAEQFTEIGYAFLTFNNRGSGENYEFFKIENGKISNRVEVGQDKEIFEECIFDIQGAVDFAKSCGYTEIVLQGHSYGCNKIIYYTLKKSFVGGLVLLAPVDIHGIKLAKLANDQKSLDMFRYENQTLDPRLAKLQNKIIVQIGTADKYILQKNKQDCLDYLGKAFPNTELTGNIIANATHGYDFKYGEVAKNVANWLKGVSG